MLGGALLALSSSISRLQEVSARDRVRQDSTFSSAKVWIGRIVSHSLQLGQCHMKRCVLYPQLPQR